MEKIKIVFIAGFGRSGSTVISKILNSYTGFFNVNEICFIQEKGFNENQLCSCGKAFDQCSTWSQIKKSVLSEEKNFNVAYQQQRLPKIATLPYRSKYKKDADKVRYQDYIRKLELLYSKIHQGQTSPVIIDSSKLPSYLYILLLSDLFDVYVIHLVKDPVEVAASWKKKVKRADVVDDSYMEQYSITNSSLKWLSWNYVIQSIVPKERYHFLKYEDFLINPRKAINNILTFLKEERDNDLFIDDFSVELSSEDHGIWGNPMRHSNGILKIRKPVSLQGLTPLASTWVKLLTWPLTASYRY